MHRTNPLDLSEGFPPALSIAGPDSLAQTIQRFPDLRVVETLNTVTAAVMVDPLVRGDHLLFLACDDEAAKRDVVDLLGEFGWPPERVLDLGDLRAARGMEMYVILWVSVMQHRGDPIFNITVAGR